MSSRWNANLAGSGLKTWFIVSNWAFIGMQLALASERQHYVLLQFSTKLLKWRLHISQVRFCVWFLNGLLYKFSFAALHFYQWPELLFIQCWLLLQFKSATVEVWPHLSTHLLGQHTTTSFMNTCYTVWDMLVLILHLFNTARCKT